MKKGFTLIELLAVIVVLAIIALIVVPVVLNIINDAKASSAIRSAEFYLDGVEYAVANAFLYQGGLSDGTYPITESGDICKTELPCASEDILKVDVNGEKPVEGTVTVKSGNIFLLEIKLNEQVLAKASFDDTFILLGDVNGDGTVNKDDAIELSNALAYSREVSSLRNGDMNNDGLISVSDINLLSTRVGKVIVTELNGIGLSADIDGNGLIDEDDMLLFDDYLSDSNIFAVNLDVNNDGTKNISDFYIIKSIANGTAVIEY